MPWYKNKQALMGASVLCLAFLIEGFLFSGFFSIPIIKSLTGLQVFTITFCVGTILLATNSLTLVLVAKIAQLRKGKLEDFSNKIGITNFTLLFLVLPLLISTFFWSIFSKWILSVLGVAASISTASVILLFVLNVVVFSSIVYYTSKFLFKKGE